MEYTASEVKEKIRNIDRYCSFTVLDTPQVFRSFFAGKDFDVVQLHSLYPVDDGIVGFCGVCSWESGKLKSLDGDSYSEEMTVYGYREWSDEEASKGLDILVGTDW